MESIISKRHFFNFYGRLVFCIVFVTIGLFMILVDHPKNKAMLTFGGLLMIVPLIYIFITVIKKSPKITIDKKHIQFNTTTFKIENINEIVLTGMYQFSITGEMDGTKIIFKDGSVKYIFDSMYGNISQIKLKLDYLVNNNKYTVVEKVRTNITLEHFYKYKGYLVYSFRGITYLILTSIMILPFFSGKQATPEKNYLTIFFILLFTLLFQWQLNYFELNKNYFKIKSHMKFWKNDIYKVEDIKEVTFQSQGKAPNFMKIIFKDYTAKKYFAATLSNRKWKELQRALEELNIKVINKL